MSAKMIIAAKRYAKALTEIAKKDANSEDVENTLEQLAKSIESSKDLSSLISEPAFTGAERSEILLVLLKKLNSPHSIINLVGLLCQKGRSFLLPEIAKQFKNLSLESKGLKEAFVESAQELSAMEQKQIQEKIEKSLKQKVVLKTLVKPSLVAGLKIHVGGETWDASLNAQFDQLKSQLGNV